MKAYKSTVDILYSKQMQQTSIGSCHHHQKETKSILGQCIQPTFMTGKKFSKEHLSA